MEPLSATVVGLGRVGLPLTVFLASRGVHVKGVESDAGRRKSIAVGNLASDEPSLPDLYARHHDRIKLANLATAVRTTNISFVVVPTPARPDGTLSDEGVGLVVRQIAAASGQSRHPHLIVIVSTLMPGTLSGTLTAIIRSLPSAQVQLCYSPVFVALGSVFGDLESPPFVLIGADDEEGAERLTGFYAGIGYEESWIARMNAVNAEIAKLSLNCFLAMKVTFANAVTKLCDAVPGGCAQTILKTISRDARVGSGYLRAGAPYGGPCLPRDIDALIRFADERGVAPILARAVKESNHDWYLTLLQEILKHAPRPGGTFGIVGLMYKRAADYLDHGFGASLARDLIQRGYRVIAHEPGAKIAPRDLQPGVDYVDEVEEVARTAEVCVLTYADTELRERLESAADGCATLIDIWRLHTVQRRVWHG